MQCPDDNTLTRWLRRSLEDAQQRAVGEHVRSCGSCSSLIEALGTSFEEQAPAQTIGRYVVLRPIGSGGFGVVYLAWDPQLDRQIALKVLRPADRAAAQVAADLLREAKAMAKLSHPNVTTVFDVAAVGEQVAIAMELIDGTNAHEWLGQQKRSPADVLRVFLAAAEGLAAAHAAGLVHRDFKPGNVLVGKDGRVAVTDFGLARAETTGGPRSGTPKYMAPEQRRGEAVDARADQYSFAVALKEALGDAAPRVLARSLADTAADRFPDMRSLIAALAPDRRRKPMRYAAALALALSPIALAYTWSASRDRLCSGAPARVEAIFPASLSQRLTTEWGAAFEPANRTLGAWLSRWARVTTEACEATRLRGEQPDDVLTARMSCLDRSYDQARAMVETLSKAAPEERSAAARLPSQLEPPERCMDAGPLLREERPAPERRAAVRQVRFDIEQARAERNLGRLERAAELAERSVARAAELAYAPLIAEASLFAGEGQLMLGRSEAARASLLRAAHEATKGRSDRTAADAWVALVLLDGLVPEEAVARPWREAATAAAERVRGDLVIEARLANALGLSLATGGRLKEALEQQRLALAALARAYGSDAPQLGPQRHKVAELMLDLGMFASAAKEAERSRDEIAAAFGAEHPLMAAPLAVLAECACARGAYALCLEHVERAVEVRSTGRTAADHPTFIPKHVTAAVALRGLGRFDEAEARFDAAERIAGGAWLARVLAARGGLERTGKALELSSGADRVKARAAHAEALAAAGRFTEAEKEYIELAAVLEPPALGAALLGQAKAMIAQGRSAEAVPLLQRAAQAAGEEDGKVAAEAARLTGQPSSSSPRPSP